MTQHTNPLPRSRAALERLAEAVAGLDRAVAETGEMTTQMATELAAVKTEKAALEQVVDSVSARLDGAIERVQNLLEG